VSGTCCAGAEASCPDIPALRYDADPAGRHADGCAGLSSFTLSGPDQYVAFGGEVRQRYEYTRNPRFGADAQDEHRVWLQRYALHSDVQLGRQLRAFVELQSVLENGRPGGPTPVDEDKLDFQNAFLEREFEFGRGTEVRVRAGRQEVELGSARLISLRDGPNVRRTFDGLRVLAERGSWTIDALALRPRRDRKGVFDDSTLDSQLLWGVYATRAPREGRPLGLDIYYLVRNADSVVYDQSAARERRQTLGLRLFGASSGWHWNVESILQSGSFGAGNLRAWSIASEAGYTWSEQPWQPGVKLSTNIASGDRDRTDPDLQNAHPLYPRGNYFSQVAILGPQNFYNAHAFLTLRPSIICTLTIDYDAFWRLSTDDGVYGPNGSLLRSGQGSDERLVATALSVTAEWKFNRNLSFAAIYTHFSPRQFLEQTGPAEAVDFVDLSARFRF
jgi:hypothetical protein